MQAGESLIDTAQVFLTGYDVALSRLWREEERKWRAEDLNWREKERRFQQHDYAFMDQERQWRRADIEQRNLENARWLWQKFVEKNRREVEEKAGQLKAISNLAALLAGFAIVAFLEMQFTFNQTSQVKDHKVILPIHGLSTASTVAVLLNCVVICTLLLSSVLRTGKSYVSEEEEAEFMINCRHFVENYRPGDRPPAPGRSFATQWANGMESQWRHALLLFGIGLPMFCVQFALASWVKFWQSTTTAMLVSIIMGVTVIICVVLQHMWRSQLLARDPHQAGGRYEQASMGMPFDWHLQPCPVELWSKGQGISQEDLHAAQVADDMAASDNVYQGLSLQVQRDQFVDHIAPSPIQCPRKVASTSGEHVVVRDDEQHTRHKALWNFLYLPSSILVASMDMGLRLLDWLARRIS